MRVTILGCGGSGGVPLIGDHWGACNPRNPKNRRLRVSILVEEGETAILVDTSPDLRQQALAAGLKKLDAVLFTHCHADHLNGIDDLRPINRLIERPLDVYGSPATIREIKERFGYVFEPPQPGFGFYKPVLEPHEVTERFAVGPVPVIPFEQDHGFTTTTGYRIGNVAYSTDVVNLPGSSFAALENLDLWIVDCLRFDPHPTHAHLDKALDWITYVKPKRAVLTHMNQSLDYDEVAMRCPPGVEPAFDGMVIETR